MSPIRRTISLMFALTLIVVGLGAAIYLLFFALRWKGWMLMAAGFVTALGSMWFWEDLPKARGKSVEGD
jgi:membrane protein YdbS with pleckstrin-like domain